jgi:putative ABC transport system substrate-binding protein
VSNRRQFIALLSGAATVWPLAAHGQQRAMPVIGVLDARSPGATENLLRAFRQGLKDTGYVEGENVALEYRWAENQMDRLPALAAELIRRRVTLIAAIGPARRLRQRPQPQQSRLSSSSTKTRSSLVLSLASPGRAAI